MPAMFRIEVERGGTWHPSVKYPRQLSQRALRAVLPLPRGYRATPIETAPTPVLGVDEGDAQETRPRARPETPRDLGWPSGDWYLEYFSPQSQRWIVSGCPYQATEEMAHERVRLRDFTACSPECEYRVRRRGSDEIYPPPAPMHRVEIYRRAAGGWVPSRAGTFATLDEATAAITRQLARFPSARYRVAQVWGEGATAVPVVPERWIVEYHNPYDSEDYWEQITALGILPNRFAAQAALEDRATETGYPEAEYRVRRLY